MGAYALAMRFHLAVLVGFALLPFPAAATEPVLSSADKAAAFRAGGFTLLGRRWSACGDPGTASYEAGAIDAVKDLDGDGRPEAILTEGSTYCFGNTGSGFKIVSRQADGTWKLITESTGIARILTTRGVGGWPDIEVGGPGFCFPVERWNGRAYVVHRYQYEGKRCRP